MRKMKKTSAGECIVCQTLYRFLNVRFRTLYHPSTRAFNWDLSPEWCDDQAVHQHGARVDPLWGSDQTVWTCRGVFSRAVRVTYVACFCSDTGRHEYILLIWTDVPWEITIKVQFPLKPGTGVIVPHRRDTSFEIIEGKSPLADMPKSQVSGLDWIWSWCARDAVIIFASVQKVSGWLFAHCWFDVSDVSPKGVVFLILDMDKTWR